MKAVEFEGRRSGNHIAVPDEIAEKLPEHSALRVIVLLEGSEDDDWRALGLERFAAAYSDQDAMHEALIDEPATR